MTDNPLVEVVAKYIEKEACRFSSPVDLYVKGEAMKRWLEANPDADEIDALELNIDWSAKDWSILATAALRAIEDAGWKVVPVEATPDMENAAYEVQVKGADLHDFTAHDCAKDIWAAMIAAAPTG